MINHVSYQGRFTRDLELRISNNISVINFTLAWSEKFGDNEVNCFLHCVAYRGTAEFIKKYFEKGDMVLVEGRLMTRNIQDQQGNKKSKTTLVVDKVHFCGSKKKQANPAASVIDDDELPF